MSFVVRTFDLEKLAKLPESDTVLRLMWALNEMHQLSHLGKLIEGEYQTNPEMWKYRDCVTASLTRQRSSKVSEILEEVVKPVLADNAAETYPYLNSAIASDGTLLRLKENLRKFFYDEDKKKEFARHRRIRHRITDHFDHKRVYALLPGSMEKTLAKMTPDESGIKRGWLLAGNYRGNRDILRFFAVDDILNTGWQELILEIPHNEKGYDDVPEVAQARDFTLSFMRLYFQFANKLIDVLFEREKLWLPDTQITDLLYRLPEATSTTPLEILYGEQHAVPEMLSFLGETNGIIDSVTELYYPLLALIANSPKAPKLYDDNQRAAIFHCIQAMRYNLVMTAVTLLRGHVNEVTNYGRRSIEIASFLIEICGNAKAAKHWMEMGKSNSARNRYKSAFSAHQLVKKHKETLTKSVTNLYDNYCMFVHPSYASMHHQIKIVGHEHQFHYFEYQTNEQRVHLILQLFIGLNTHVQLLHALLSFFKAKDPSLDSKTWAEGFEGVCKGVEAAKKQWLPLIKQWHPSVEREF